MSTESTSQPPAASDKARAPKGPISTSAFINKGGKSFAPKAVRRRPGAAAAASTPKATAPAASTTAQPSQVQLSDNTNASPTPAPEPQTGAYLPTPVATQNVGPRPVEQTEQAVAGPASAPPESSPLAVDSAQSAPTSLVDAVAPEQGKSIQTVPTQRSTGVHRTPPPIEQLESRPPSEQPSQQALEQPRHVVDGPSPTLPEPISAVQEVVASESASTEVQSLRASATEQPSNDSPRPPSKEPTGAIDAPVQTSEVVQEAAVVETPTTVAQESSSGRTRRNPPWTAVNAPPDNDGNDVPTTSGPQPKPRRRRKPITLQEMDEEDRLAEEEEQLARPKRASARSRGKRRAPDLANENAAEDAAPPSKKARKPRKDKGKKRAAVEGVEEIEDGEAAEGGETRTKKKRKKQNTAQAEGANVGQEGAEVEQQPKRKGRPPREPTPSDAEDEVIDPGATLMNSIASRNIRVGKLSDRERQMRTINWDEVKQARREKEKYQTAREIQVEMEKLRKEQEAEEANPTADASGPSYVMIDGHIVHKAGTGQIDEAAEAQRAHDAMEVVVEDDLTNQVNARSFLRNNKRFPNEFLLPGQGKHWSFQDTEDFYRAMSIFGTDFAMMESLFPGVGRKSIKKKFNREERRDPQRVKETLHAQLNNNWEEYLELTGRVDTDFADVDNIKAQLEAEAQEMQVAIDQAKKEAEERKRQRRIAGVESEDEAAGDKENGTSKAKKGKKAAKKVGFELAADEEVVGTVEDDDNWGRE